VKDSPPGGRPRGSSPSRLEEDQFYQALVRTNVNRMLDRLEKCATPCGYREGGGQELVHQLSLDLRGGCEVDNEK